MRLHKFWHYDWGEEKLKTKYHKLNIYWHLSYWLGLCIAIVPILAKMQTSILPYTIIVGFGLLGIAICISMYQIGIRQSDKTLKQ
jgi:hypothetical protein